MTGKQTKHSIEEQVEDWAKRQLHAVKYYTKTEAINPEIDEALKKAPSKQGGTGANYPDIKLFIETSEMRRIPVMIEVKGTKGDLAKLSEEGAVLNTNKDGKSSWQNIAKYAVNGAVHYALAILEGTESYKEVIAIGVNGYDEPSTGKRTYEVSAWYVSAGNLFLPKLIGNCRDLSLLLPEHEAGLLEAIAKLDLTDEELEREKLRLEDDIERKLKALNQMMHEKPIELDVASRVEILAGMVMAGLGVPGQVSPLKADDLRGELGESSHDGQVIMNKIRDYLREKGLPDEKRQTIVNLLSTKFIDESLYRPADGESKLKTIYREVKKNIMPFLTGELHNIDFTGRLFNVMNDWVKVPDHGENDVVLTPRYVTELMARLCEVNMDSYVWDFATGSAGFLISAMNLMIADARQKLHSPEEIQRKEQHIKMTQLLGIEKLSDIYMLAVLNMILMKDGSANIINGDSLQFDGCYEQGAHRGEHFPATVFLLNPPYSANGKGLVFVETALSMMSQGRAAVLIQENAGSGKGLPYAARILQHSTLVASIHMGDIFCGKASVQTAIYVFDVGRPHDPHTMVRFIDFSEDGYTRTNRKKSSQNVNLRDTDHARERYEEVEKVVRFGSSYLNYFKENYIEDTITLNGDDWTYAQHLRHDTRPTEADFRQVVKDYLAWRVGEIIKADDSLGKQ